MRASVMAALETPRDLLPSRVYRKTARSLGTGAERAVALFSEVLRGLLRVFQRFADSLSGSLGRIRVFVACVGCLGETCRVSISE